MTVELSRPNPQDKVVIVTEGNRIVGQLPNGEEVVIGSQEIGFNYCKSDGKQNVLGRGEILILADGVFALGGPLNVK